MATADRSRHPDLLAFRGHFGRLCALSAEAIVEHGVSREVVGAAFRGEHTQSYPDATRVISRQRIIVNEAIERTRYALGKVGCPALDASKLIIEAAKQARDAVQGEWGHDIGPKDRPRWQRLSLPIVDPSP